MMSRGVLSIGIIGIIVVALILSGFFLFNIERVAINMWALSFLLISICIFFISMIALRLPNPQHSSLFLNAGVTTTLALYVISTSIITFLSGMYRDNLNTFIFIELANIALFAIIAVAILAFSRKVASSNITDAEKVGSNQPKRGGF